jgi:hypothetical protein
MFVAPLDGLKNDAAKLGICQVLRQGLLQALKTSADSAPWGCHGDIHHHQT